jgi:hypothetical protein
MTPRIAAVTARNSSSASSIFGIENNIRSDHHLAANINLQASKHQRASGRRLEKLRRQVWQTFGSREFAQGERP